MSVCVGEGQGVEEGVYLCLFVWGECMCVCIGVRMPESICVRALRSVCTVCVRPLASICF